MAQQTTRPVSVRLPERVADQVGMLAARKNQSVADYLRQIVFEHLQDQTEIDRLSGLEARLMARLDGIDKSINSLVAEEA
jgi:hypothetical protein